MISFKGEPAHNPPSSSFSFSPFSRQAFIRFLQRKINFDNFMKLFHPL